MIEDRSSRVSRTRELSRHIVETVRRAFVEFLKIPTLAITGFLVLALVTYLLDDAKVGYGKGSAGVWGGFFSDPQAARAFLGTIAGSIITVTSITFSLLLIAVQQGASSLTSLVYDQFLRRRSSQLYFGVFIGLALYSLIILVSVNSSHQPKYGVALGGLMTAGALYMLILLIYSTIDQMRPVVIIKAIHDHALTARKAQLDLLRNTRRAPRPERLQKFTVVADYSGFLTRIDYKELAKVAEGVADDTEIVMLVSIGDYVAFGDPVNEIRSPSALDAAGSPLEQRVRAALALEDQRDLDTDPAFGIEQLATIGWTSISTAKSNPHPGLLAILNLRDLLSRWLELEEGFGADNGSASVPSARVVYSDNVAEQLMRAFESLAVVASESIQHQSAAELYRGLAAMFHRLPAALQCRVQDLILRSLSGLGDHILTAELEAALSGLVDAMTASGRPDAAGRVRAAMEQLGRSIGRLNSRSTRVDCA